MKVLQKLMVVTMLICLMVVPAYAQGQNTSGGVNENARDKIDSKTENAQGKIAEGKAKGGTESGQDTSKGKDVLSGN